jgi:hypothetical protein
VTKDLKPYLVPAPGTVVMHGWEMYDTEWVPMPAEFEGWDAGTDILLRRRVDVDLVKLRSETGLGPYQTVLSTSWTSSTTGMRDASHPVPLPSSGAALLQPRLAGSRIGGAVDIRTTLCVSAMPPAGAGLGAAQYPGSVLAEDFDTIVVDRGSLLFPVDSIDFARTRLPPDASWHLETSIDLMLPFFATFRLLINSKDTELFQAVTRGNRDRRQRALLDELESGVAGLITEIAIHLQEELRDNVWPSDSVGDVLSRVLHVWRSTVPPTPETGNLALFRTLVAAAVRTSGKGRQFQ